MQLRMKTLNLIELLQHAKLMEATMASIVVQQTQPFHQLFG
jgi:hypothetical protein